MENENKQLQKSIIDSLDNKYFKDTYKPAQRTI